MRDSKTGERFIVRATEFGPSVFIRSFEDFDYIEDILCEQHDIEISHRQIADGFELFIHTPLDLSSIQRLIDEIREPSK